MAMARKLTALLLGAVMTAGMAAVPAYAETTAVQTVVVSREFGAKTVEWNGKTALKKGTNYVVTKNVTVSKKITVPAGVTLTVKNGAKLSVGFKGSLYIKGAVTVGKGSTLAVSGKLYEYKDKKLTVSGTLKFGSKSDITLNGKVTQGTAGVISGTPKKLSVGANAELSLKGKNNCAKLNKALYPQQISDTVMGYVETFISNDLELYPVMCKMYPKKMLDGFDEQLSSLGLTLKDYCDTLSAYLKESLKQDERVDMSMLKNIDLSSVEIVVKDLENCYDDLDAEFKAGLKEYYDDTRIVYTFDIVLMQNGKEIDFDDLYNAYDDDWDYDDNDDDHDDDDDNDGVDVGDDMMMALVGDTWYAL